MMASEENQGLSQVELEGRIDIMQSQLRSLEDKFGSTLEAIEDLQDFVAWGVRQMLPAVPSPTGGMSSGEYQLIVRCMRMLLRRELPPGARVAVISRGDDELLQLDGLTASHFPQTDAGEWTGNYPATGAAAIAQLEIARARGIEFLAIPSPGSWWLEHYDDLRRHLDCHYRRILVGDVCAVFELSGAPAPEATPMVQVLTEVAALCRDELTITPSVLDAGTGLDLAAELPDCTVFAPPGRADDLPYFDASVDVVVLPAAAPGAALSEARRVARVAVVAVSGPDRGAAAAGEVVWKRPAVESRRLTVVVAGVGPVERIRGTLGALAGVVRMEPSASLVLAGPAEAALAIDWPSLPAQVRERTTFVEVREPGLGAAWNEAVRATEGDDLVFLTPGILPFGRWWPPLLRLLAEPVGAGVAGGWTLDHEGTIREAGATIGSDGRLLRLGAEEVDLDAPEFAHVREVGGLTTGAVAIRRGLFDAIGGFDATVQSGRAGLMDLCLRIAGLGQRILSQPASLAVEVWPSDDTALDRTELEQLTERSTLEPARVSTPGTAADRPKRRATPASNGAR